MGTAAELDTLRTNLAAALAAGDLTSARSLALQAQAILGTSPARQKHGESETEWNTSGEWLDSLMSQLAAAEARAAASSAGSSIRRSKVRYVNAGEEGVYE